MSEAHVPDLLTLPEFGEVEVDPRARLRRLAAAGRPFAVVTGDARVAVRLPDWDLFAAAYELPGSEPLFEADERVGHWVVLPGGGPRRPTHWASGCGTRTRSRRGACERGARTLVRVGRRGLRRDASRLAARAVRRSRSSTSACRERPDVVDIAAGTGKLTRTLARVAGDARSAVEPDAELRAVLQRELPAVAVLDGTAEVLPLRSGERRRGVRRAGLPLVRRRPRAGRDRSASCARAAS